MDGERDNNRGVEKLPAGDKICRDLEANSKNIGFYFEWIEKSWEILSRGMTWLDLDYPGIIMAVARAFTLGKTEIESEKPIRKFQKQKPFK